MFLPESFQSCWNAAFFYAAPVSKRGLIKNGPANESLQKAVLCIAHGARVGFTHTVSAPPVVIDRRHVVRGLHGSFGLLVVGAGRCQVSSGRFGAARDAALTLSGTSDFVIHAESAERFLVLEAIPV
jgi:hypothetical protein